MEGAKETKNGNIPYIERVLELLPLLDKKPHFLFGPY